MVAYEEKQLEQKLRCQQACQKALSRDRDLTSTGGVHRQSKGFSTECKTEDDRRRPKDRVVKPKGPKEISVHVMQSGANVPSAFCNQMYIIIIKRDPGYDVVETNGYDYLKYEPVECE